MLSIFAVELTVIVPVIKSVLFKVPVTVVFCNDVVPLTVRLLLTTVLPCILTIPVPLARNSKLLLETVVVIKLPLILMSSINALDSQTFLQLLVEEPKSYKPVVAGVI